MKKILVVLAMVLVVGCDEDRIVIVKDGVFNQTAMLASNGLTVHHLGLDALEVKNAKKYVETINFLNAATVVLDLGRTDLARGTPIDQFNADFDELVQGLPVVDAYAGRTIVCVQRDATYTPPASCGSIIQPSELPALYASLFPPVT